MIEIACGKTGICFHFTFFAAVALLMIIDDSNIPIYGLYACLLHESGHLAAMLICRQPIKRLVFYGAGIKIVQAENELLTGFVKELFILSAGCCVNFAVYAIFCKSDMYLFGIINLIVGLFNILPLNSLDGGKIIILCFYKLFTYEKAECAEKILRGINIIFIPMAAIVFYLVGIRNFTLYTTLIYLLFTAVIM